MPMACPFEAVHPKLLGTATIAKSVKVEMASIVRAHHNLRGDRNQASVLVYRVYVRNRDGGWGAGGLSVVEPTRPGQSQLWPSLAVPEKVVCSEVVGNGGVVVWGHLGDLKKLARRW